MGRLLEDSREREVDLVRRARAGDRTAFEELTRTHFRGVYALLFRLAGNHEDAEDLAQDTFVRAWRALPNLRDGEALSAWLRRIALHIARDHFRVRSRRGPSESIERFEGDERAGAARHPGEQLGEREMMAGLRAALERLPHRLRAPLFLRVLEGLEYDDVARETGVRPATARTQVMQARKLLLRWLAPWFEGRKS